MMIFDCHLSLLGGAITNCIITIYVSMGLKSPPVAYVVMLCVFFLLLLVAIWTAYIEEASLIKSELFFNITGHGHQTKSRCVV